MSNWRYECALNQVIAQMSEQFDLTRLEESVPVEVRRALSEEVKKALPLVRFAPTIMDARSIAEMNRILENVFDTADAELVWCGFVI